MSSLSEPLLPSKCKSQPPPEWIPYLATAFLCFLSLCLQPSPSPPSLAALLSGHCLCLLLVWKLEAGFRRGKCRHRGTIGIAASMPFVCLLLVKSDLTAADLGEAAGLAVWCWPYTRLFEGWKLGPGQTYIQVTCALLGVFGSSYLLGLDLGGAEQGIELGVVFVLLRIHTFASIPKPPVKPKIARELTVIRDFKRVKEVMEYLGTLEGGKVDPEDFLPALYAQCPDLPVYVKEALDSLCGGFSSSPLLTFEDMINAGNAAFHSHRSAI